MATLPQMNGLKARFRWSLPDQLTLEPQWLTAGSAWELTPRLVGLLAARGSRGTADLAAFFGEPEVGLHDPRLLPDAGPFRDRVRAAADARERVLVFGDFDADGLTGMAIMVRTLRLLGLDAAPYVPSRANEGHGLSLAAVERARSEGRSVIVTVDCGSSSATEVEAARAAGIDVLITDHHQLPQQLPRATALVNPHRADSVYPDDRLAGSGVAFKIAQLLLAEVPGGPAQALEMADLAVIGTVADVAPIVGENRSLARLGLAQLKAGTRPGLAALMKRAGLNPERLDLEGVAFGLAPRINAVGRIGESMAAAELLLTDDPAAAATLASELDAVNDTRRAMTAATLADARVAAQGLLEDRAIVVAGDWPVGIIGLVAGRLAEELDRPCVVVSRLTDPWRGSARSPGGFDLAAAFARCGHLFERHGGHPQAAGCSMQAVHFDSFRTAFLDLVAERMPGRDPRPELRLDLALEGSEVDYALLRELDRLGPSGPGNPPVLVGISGLTVARVRAANGGHTQLTLRKGREVLDGICFGRDDLVACLREGDHIDVVARLVTRSFGGFESLQLEIRDAAPSGTLSTIAAATRSEGSAAGVGIPALVGDAA